MQYCWRKKFLIVLFHYSVIPYSTFLWVPWATEEPSTMNCLTCLLLQGVRERKSRHKNAATTYKTVHRRWRFRQLWPANAIHWTQKRITPTTIAVVANQTASKLESFKTFYLDRTIALDRTQNHMEALEETLSRGKVSAELQINIKPFVINKDDPTFTLD